MHNNEEIIHTQEVEKLILSHPFFSFFSVADIAALAQLMKSKKVSSGENITQEGDMVKDLYLIAQGEASIEKKIVTKDKVAIIPIAVLHPGEAIGLSKEGFFAKEGRHTATVNAISDMFLFFISVAELDNFISQRTHLYPGFKKSLEKILKMHLIKETEPFAGLHSEDIYWFAERIHSITVPAGTILFNQGDEGDKAYLIESGKVQIIKKDQNEQIILNIVLERTQIFGEIALITSAPRNATASTLEECKLLVIERESLSDVFRHNSHVANIFDHLIKERLSLKKAKDISTVERRAVDGSIIIGLTDKKHHLLNLSEEGLYIWNLIDGKRTVNDIIEESTKQFGSNSKQTVEYTISSLLASDFIQAKNNPPLSLLQKIKKKFR